LSLIAGLYPTTEGDITIAGANPFLLPVNERRKIIGIVPQNVQLFNGSILENISLKNPEISKEDAWEALDIVGLSETVSTLEKGIDTMIGEGEAKLSFGEMQLLSLARAIVTRPSILLLDELTSGLDALTEKILLNTIRKVSYNRTIITISHRISGIIDADIVHIMDGGKIIESGSPNELSQKEGWFAIYKRLEEHGWKVS
jgi:ATP-binding cassette subfamily B multidrug efflux pump